MQLEWIDFYTEFATKLLLFKEDRNTLIQKIHNIYISMNRKMPKLGYHDKIIDLDPFTIFGLFNKDRKNAKRIMILNGIGKEFKIDSKVPNNLYGIPILNRNQKVNFYDVKSDHFKDDINTLWTFFETALLLADSNTEINREKFSVLYNKVQKQHGIKWNIISGLYWIRPYFYINLDSINIQYIKNMEQKESIPKEWTEIIKESSYKIRDAKEYLKIRDICQKVLDTKNYPYKSFPELSYYALTGLEQENQLEQKNQKEIENTIVEKIDNTTIKEKMEIVKEHRERQARIRTAIKKAAIIKERGNLNKEIPYVIEDFLEEVYMDRKQYDILTAIIRRKKNVILQGSPGVGKTFLAKRLAYSMIGKKDDTKVHMIQFHQGYSYEDFIMGFRPCMTGFELKKGVFYHFCKQAESDRNHEYFFLIDEINRGNLSKIFGELFMLIEEDKRGTSLQLLYSEEPFAIPENVYIIGMMNTADRSLAMLDYALRRRFAFFEIKPAFASEGFQKYQANMESEKLNQLIDCVKKLNDIISEDESLGSGFCIGHSYFCNLKKEDNNDQILSSIVEFELIPLLQEYWFDEPSKIKNWSDKLREIIK